jgi:uncharacterized membrane protein
MTLARPTRIAVRRGGGPMAVKHGGHLWHAHPAVRSGDELTRGERAADVMRNCFGSWLFVGCFLAFMACWMILNSVLLSHGGFDKYPWILLNLGLSMMAGLQGALILIAAKRADRVAAEQATVHYHETAKIDGMAGEILTLTQRQMDLLDGIEHANAELNFIRQAIAPGAPNPAAGTDPAGRPAPVSREAAERLHKPAEDGGEP